MENNFNNIKKYLIFNSSDDFYIVFLKKRRKDNPGLVHGEVEISTFYITSIKDLEELMPIITAVCDATNSRAYINLNSRSFKSVALHTNKKLGEILVCGDYKYARKIYQSEANSHSNSEDKLWIIDFDYEDGYGSEKNDVNTLDEMCNYLEIEQKKIGNKPLIDKIKTKYGVHIITRPFKLNKFKEKYPSIDVHKEPTTLLYIS
jgi:hypothetical protein